MLQINTYLIFLSAFTLHILADLLHQLSTVCKMSNKEKSAVTFFSCHTTNQYLPALFITAFTLHILAYFTTYQKKILLHSKKKCSPLTPRGKKNPRTCFLNFIGKWQLRPPLLIRRVIITTSTAVKKAINHRKITY